MIKLPVYCPELAGQIVGLNYDMAAGEKVTHQNRFTSHPIEDPQRSFLIDHNREDPTKISLDITVSVDPVCTVVPAISGPLRITMFYEFLLAAKARQSVSVDAFFTIFTGVRIYRNMAIEQIAQSRDDEMPGIAKFSLSLHEFRFAVGPQMTARNYPMQAQRGPRAAGTGQRLTTPSDGIITQGTTTAQPIVSSGAIPDVSGFPSMRGR